MIQQSSRVKMLARRGLVLALYCLIALALAENKKREGKIFSLFSVVTFPNE